MYLYGGPGNLDNLIRDDLSLRGSNVGLFGVHAVVSGNKFKPRDFNFLDKGLLSLSRLFKLVSPNYDTTINS